jgi:quercetin dioxygenase-like cupin family protein
MADTKPPYRAEHVGSLPRPERLMRSREQHAAGKLPKPELTRIEDECIREAVAMQERVGIGAITDGEYRKRGWREFLYDKCDGFGPETVERAFPIRLYDGTTAPPIREPKVTAKLKRREPLSAEDFSALKTMTRRPIKAAFTAVNCRVCGHAVHLHLHQRDAAEHRDDVFHRERQRHDELHADIGRSRRYAARLRPDSPDRRGHKRAACADHDPRTDGDELAQLPSYQLDVDRGRLHRLLARISDAAFVRRRVVMTAAEAVKSTQMTTTVGRRRPTVEIKRSGSQPSGKGPAEWFTGTVRIDPLFQSQEPARAAGNSVTFEPSARTAWHTHPLGQTLIVTCGCGWVQRWGGPIEEIRPGDVVWFSPGEKHWHGAKPTTAMAHIAIQEALNGKPVEWMEHVSDEQYRK